MSLFYATDFYDQLENRIVPALRAGYVVLADRYIFTLMARDMVRGADIEWLRSLYSMALVPDAVFQLVVTPGRLAQRVLRNKSVLDYWESGMDLGLSRDWYDSFQRYQRKLRTEFRRLENVYSFEVLNGNRSVMAIHRDLKNRVQALLDRKAVTMRTNHDEPHSSGERNSESGEAGRELSARI
jgi:dTMP kinase